MIANQVGNYEVAIQRLRKALTTAPEYAEAHCALGTALQGLGRHDEALACFRRAVEINPSFSEAQYNLGNALRAQGKQDEAVECYRRCIALSPDFADAHNNLGLLLYEQVKLIEARDCLRRALELQPDLAESHNNLGNVLQALGEFDESGECYTRALRLNPDFAEARWNQSLLQLLRGDFQRGWAEHEWRWHQTWATPRGFSEPVWEGQPLPGKTILLYAEQGLGDTLQFIRYASLVKERFGGTVLVQVQTPLVKLLASCSGIDRLIAYDEELPPFEFHSSLLSLPLVFQTSLQTIPARVPYLSADPSLVAQWKERLAVHQGMRIGINWHGRPGTGLFRRRDIPLECFAAIAQMPGVRLISLQKGEGRKELVSGAGSGDPRTTRFAVFDPGDDVDTVHGAFMDTAAIMMNLDLVITSDTSVPHLAGALGVPVWLALPFVPDWRWLLARSDSPWYPTMRLFRQQQPGDWAGVFAEMAEALRNHPTMA